jgi:signal peptidase II
MRQRGWIVAIAAAVFGVDRALKIVVATHMQIGESITVWPHILWITYITNSGAAFSLLRHATWLFIAIAVLILLALMGYVARAPEISRRFGVGAGLLAGGTAGNLWDRAVRGRVIDYIHFRYWAIFNVADVAIVVGIGLIVWDFWQKDRKHGELSRHRKHTG